MTEERLLTPPQALLEGSYRHGSYRLLQIHDPKPRLIAFDPTEPYRRPRGLPIGNLTSQWWGDLYLNDLDHFIKRVLGAHGYLRHMDDLVCFAEEPATLRAWRSEIRDWLWEKRRLRLNLRKGHVRPTALPHPYLGYRVTRQGFDVGCKAVRRFRRNLAELGIAGDPERLRRSLAAWCGAVGFATARRS